MLSKYFHNLWVEIRKERKQTILKLLEKQRNAFLLDVGCDDGKFTTVLAKHLKSENIYGIEVTSARFKAKKAGVKVKRADLNEIFPFKSNFFDVVTADQVIEHLWNLDNFMGEIYRVLKPGGYAIISTENLASWHNVFALILGLQPFSGPNISSKKVVGFHPIHPDIENDEMPPHIKVMTLKALMSLAKIHNFTLEVASGHGYLPFPMALSKIFSKIDPHHALFITVKLRKV